MLETAEADDLRPGEDSNVTSGDQTCFAEDLPDASTTEYSPHMTDEDSDKETDSSSSEELLEIKKKSSQTSSLRSQKSSNEDSRSIFG